MFKVQLNYDSNTYLYEYGELPFCDWILLKWTKTYFWTCKIKFFEFLYWQNFPNFTATRQIWTPELKLRYQVLNHPSPLVIIWIPSPSGDDLPLFINKQNQNLHFKTHFSEPQTTWQMTIRQITPLMFNVIDDKPEDIAREVYHVGRRFIQYHTNHDRVYVL